MSRSLNRVQLLGHLGKDIEVKFTPNGVQVGRFSVATTRRWKDQKSGEWMEATDWHNCIFWRPENVASYLTKGKQVFLEGRLSHRSYEKDGEKRYATEVVVEDLTLLGGGEGGAPRRTGGASSGPAGSQAPPSQDPYDGQGITDDDVPF